ncbi:MAG: PIN domain-containing protein [Chloroflexi bacterium]|nr:PIN domain-containing protein [Chloroflexota bacterium]
MSKLILIDTSFIVALVNVRDDQHQRAVDLSLRMEESPTLITDAIMLEIGAFLARGFRKEGIAILEKLLASPQVRVVRLTPTLFDRGFSLYKQQLERIPDSFVGW